MLESRCGAGVERGAIGIGGAARTAEEESRRIGDIQTSAGGDDACDGIARERRLSGCEGNHGDKQNKCGEETIKGVSIADRDQNRHLAKVQVAHLSGKGRGESLQATFFSTKSQYQRIIFSHWSL